MTGDGDGSKWPNAKAALKQVLKESVPKGTKLSFWTFGQLPKGLQGNAINGIAPGQAPDLIAIANANFAAPEQTILRQRPMAAWDPAQIEEVSALLDGINPYFKTPLVEAMVRAATDPDLVKARGLKNLLVLTDGKDSRFEEVAGPQPGAQAHDPRVPHRSARPLGIRVTVVFFRSSGLSKHAKEAEEAEVQTARENFKPLLGLDLPGQFIEARNLGQLIETLKAGLEQKLVCRILDARETPVGELDVTNVEAEADVWWPRGLQPGTYTLRVRADRTYRQDIDLNPGDRVILQLVEGRGGGIAFARVLEDGHGQVLAPAGR